MLKTSTQKLCLLLSTIFLLGIESKSQDTLINENFGTTGSLPATWVSNDQGNGWSGNATIPSTGYTGASGGGQAYFKNVANPMAHTLTHAGVSTVGYSNLSVLWASRGTLQPYNSDVFFQYSINGTTWTSVTYSHALNGGTWAIVNGGIRISLPVAAENQANLRLRFSANRNGSGEYRIDDFTLIGYSPATAHYYSTGAVTTGAATNWEIQTSPTAFAPATVPPTTANSVTIRNGHTLTVSNDFTVGANKTFLLSNTSFMIVSPGKKFSVAGAANFNAQDVQFATDNAPVPTVGILGAVTGSLSNASKVTVQRYIPATKRAYRQIAPGLIPSTNIRDSWQNGGVNTPGVGLHITGSSVGANGLDATQTGAANLYSLTAGSSTYTPILSTNQAADKLNALKGYRLFVYGDRNADLFQSNNGGNNANDNIALNNSVTLNTKGSLITGSVVYNSAGASINGGTADASAALGANVNDFSLIANPFWSPVNFDAMTKVGINSYYIWDPTIGRRGAYVTWNTLSGTNSNGASAMTRDIQPGQAIMVLTAAANPSLTFAEANKSSVYTNTFRSSLETPSKMRIYLHDRTNGNQVVDGTTAAFRDDFAATVGSEDAIKFINSDENIALVRGTSVLGVEGRPSVSGNDTVAIRIWKLYGSNSYSLRLQGFDFDAGIEAFLHDKFLNQVHALNIDGTFTHDFSFSASDSASFYNRFQVIFKPISALPVGISSVRAYSKNNGVTVEWKNETESNMHHYEVERSIDAVKFNKIASATATMNNNALAAYSFVDASPVSGDNYYRIKAVGTSGEVKYSTIVKVTTGKTATFVSVFPNPVTDNHFTIQLNNVAKGQYKIALSNSMGQQVYAETINNASTSVSEVIDLKQQKLPSGMYQLVIRNTDGSILSTEQMLFKN